MRNKYGVAIQALERAAFTRRDEMLEVLHGFGLQPHNHTAPPGPRPYLVWGYGCFLPGILYAPVQVKLEMNRFALRAVLTLVLEVNTEHFITLEFDHPHATGGKLVTNCPHDRMPSRLRHLFLAAEWQPVVPITWADVSMIVDAYLEMMREPAQAAAPAPAAT